MGIVFVLLLLIHRSEEIQDSLFDCGHRPPSPEEVIHGVHTTSETDGQHSMGKRSTYSPLRIHLHYDNSVSNLPYSHITLVKRLVEEAADFWQRTLMVRPSNIAIRLNRQCVNGRATYRNRARYCVDGCAAVTRCGDITIPVNHLERCYFYDSSTYFWRSESQAGPGVDNSDFVLYVAALATQRCQGGRTIAYAAHCQQEVTLDRPVAGYFSICPNVISTKFTDQTQLLSTIKHEILHALGFTAGLYAFYRDSYGQPLTLRNPDSNLPPYNPSLQLYKWSDRVVQRVLRPRWKRRRGFFDHAVNVIVTPRVVVEVRRHFNCDSLEGAELEDQGILGTALTHWEKRIFENEAMTGTYTQNPVISRITLALMEDTGWYKPDYSRAEELDWGRKLGCDFVTKSCLEWMQVRQARYGDIHPFCKEVRTGILRTDCTRNRKAVAFCNLAEFQSPLPEKYQYFSKIEGVPDSMTDRYGGTVALADYCPYLQEFNWKEEGATVRDSRCTLSQNNPAPSKNFYGERYGSKSICVNHRNPWSIQQCLRIIRVSHSGSGCYQYDCSNDAGLILLVNGKSYQCLKKGQVIPVTYVSNHYLHRGTIVCPSCFEACLDEKVICPPEREPYDLVTEPTFLQAPCRGTHSFNYWTIIQTIYINCCLIITILQIFVR